MRMVLLALALTACSPDMPPDPAPVEPSSEIAVEVAPASQEPVGAEESTEDSARDYLAEVEAKLKESQRREIRSVLESPKGKAMLNWSVQLHEAMWYLTRFAVEREGTASTKALPLVRPRHRPRPAHEPGCGVRERLPQCDQNARPGGERLFDRGFAVARLLRVHGTLLCRPGPPGPKEALSHCLSFPTGLTL
jgi:hypothetical protein